MRQSSFCYICILSCVGMATMVSVGAFVPTTRQQHSKTPIQLKLQVTTAEHGDNDNGDNSVNNSVTTDRRGMLQSAVTGAGVAALTAAAFVTSTQPAMAAPQAAASTEVNLQQYADFTKAPEGWSYRDVNPGSGDSASQGDRVVYEWSGYTIGYFGRPFEAKGGPQGGAFDKAQDFSRTIIGKGEIVKGMELAMTSMKAGGIRQVIVPFGELGYPSTKEDGAHDKIGPKPSTFSGERALNFVLDNPRVDRTLLFNVKLIRIDKSDGKGGFKRGDRA